MNFIPFWSMSKDLGDRAEGEVLRYTTVSSRYFVGVASTLPATTPSSAAGVAEAQVRTRPMMHGTRKCWTARRVPMFFSRSECEGDAEHHRLQLERLRSRDVGGRDQPTHRSPAGRRRAGG